MDPTNRNTALASAFVEELARCGVHHAVLSPGSRSTPIAIALSREPAIDLTVIVDERSAAFFALGAAQSTRTPVVVLCTSGTAAANQHPAIAEADESAVPLIVLTADRPPELRGIGAGQTIDQIKLFGSSVRWFCEVGTHEADDDGLLHLRSVACRAFGVSRGDARPGPVHLNFALREPLAPVSDPGAVTATDPLALDGRDTRPLTALTDHPSEPRAEILDMLAGHATNATSGLIVAGRQSDPELRTPLAALAQATGMPILAEPTSQLRSGPHDRSLVISTYDSLLRHSSFAELTPDLVLRFGEMPTSKPLRSWLSRPGVDQIAFPGYGGWNEPTHRAAAIVRGDLAAIATGLAERVGEAGEGERDPEWTGRWTRANDLANGALGETLAATHELTEPALQAALAGCHRDGDLVYTASSMPIRDQESFLPSTAADVLFLANRGANGIDGLVSSGIGGAHASGRTTTILTGEIGLLHDIGALAAVSSSGTGVRIVVIDNGGGRIFDHLPQAAAMPAEEFERLLATPRPEFDIAKAAETFGLKHTAIESPNDLREALASATGVIEVRIRERDNRGDREALHRAIADRLLA